MRKIALTGLSLLLLMASPAFAEPQTDKDAVTATPVVLSDEEMSEVKGEGTHIHYRLRGNQWVEYRRFSGFWLKDARYYHYAGWESWIEDVWGSWITPGYRDRVAPNGGYWLVTNGGFWKTYQH